MVEPNPQLYAKHRISISNGVVHLSPLREFRVLVANFSSASKRLSKNQVVGFVTPHPWAMIRTAMPLDAVPAAEFYEGVPPLRSDDSPRATSPSTESAHPVDVVPLDHLPPHRRKQVRTLLTPYAGMCNGTLGEVRATNHRIELTPGARPFRCQPYRAGPRAREAEQTSVDEMLANGVITRSKSEWASPVVLIPKQDGSLRFCVDYRRLNALTVREKYPTPRMDECLDSLGEAKVFTTLDCNSGYWQIPVAKEDRAKTTFTCHAGTYQFNRMPFVLMNAPATFQRMLDILLSGYRWKSCLIYLDDIIIFSKDYDSHLKDVEVIIQALQQEGLSLKLKKCKFFQDSVEYLGHIIRPGELHVHPKNFKALSEATIPRTQTELRSFLGMWNVYRRFVDHFAKITAPLTAMLRKGEPDLLPTFAEDQTTAFDTLKECLISPRC